MPPAKQVRRRIMTKDEMKTAIVANKDKSGMTWEQLAAGISMSPVWTASACLGMNSMDEEKAEVLQVCPHKHWDKAMPTDPVIYRFYEMINVYGDSIKELIHEKFADGIMSAIDFSMDIAKEENPKDDRVVIT
jgi:cyanate lyase